MKRKQGQRLPGKYIIRKHEKSRQKETRKRMVREVWSGGKGIYTFYASATTQRKVLMP